MYILFQNLLLICLIYSYLNYFILVQILLEYFENNEKRYISDFALSILDEYGDLIYTVIFKEVLLKSISEIRLGYQMYDLSEKPFTITFKYNFIDVRYELGDGEKSSKSIFDIPIDVNPGKLDKSGY